MARAVQKRTLETRARLIAAAQAVIADVGYEAMRVEEVVLRAGVAKGTFFAHFKDKDALLDLLIGARIDALMDAAAKQNPQTVSELVTTLQPVHDLMCLDRYVFDLVLRYSGAAEISEIGPIATTFGRYIELVERWMCAPNFRKDIDTCLLAEGVQAFALQAMAAHFCALHNTTSMQARLEIYLNAWLLPQPQTKS